MARALLIGGNGVLESYDGSCQRYLSKCPTSWPFYRNIFLVFENPQAMCTKPSRFSRSISLLRQCALANVEVRWTNIDGGNRLFCRILWDTVGFYADGFPPGDCQAP